MKQSTSINPANPRLFVLFDMVRKILHRSQSSSNQYFSASNYKMLQIQRQRRPVVSLPSWRHRLGSTCILTHLRPYDVHFHGETPRFGCYQIGRRQSNQCSILASVVSESQILALFVVVVVDAAMGFRYRIWFWLISFNRHLVYYVRKMAHIIKKEWFLYKMSMCDDCQTKRQRIMR